MTNTLDNAARELARKRVDIEAAQAQAQAEYNAAALASLTDPKAAAKADELADELAGHARDLARLEAASKALDAERAKARTVDRSKALKAHVAEAGEALRHRQKATEKVKAAIDALGDSLVDRHVASDAARAAIFNAANASGRGIESALSLASQAAGNSATIAQALYEVVERLRALGGSLAVEFPGLVATQGCPIAGAAQEAERIGLALKEWAAQ